MPKYTFTFNDKQYSIAAKEMPCKGHLDAPRNLRMHKDKKWGDVVMFVATCNSKSDEPGRIYSIYLFKDGKTQWDTVN